MPQELILNEELRLDGWDVFRSSSRDHMIPMTSGGRALQRIKMAEALPTLGVIQGVAVSDEERAAFAAARDRAESEVLGRMSRGGAIETRYRYFVISNLTAVAVGIGEEEVEIALAPFTGVVNEVGFHTVGIGGSAVIALRTDNGVSFFKSESNDGFASVGVDCGPDFVNPFLIGVNNSTPRSELKNLRIPVISGERVLMVLRMPAPTAIGGVAIEGYIGFSTGSVGSFDQRVLSSVVDARHERSVDADRAARELEARLAIEREKTRRVQLEADARIKAAQLALEGRRVKGIREQATINELLSQRAAQERLRSRAPVVPPPPAFAAPPAQATGGKGQTFVQSWMPQQGALGYMIPDPPPGGRVNVFNDRYTIWDQFGGKVGEGPVQPVQNTSQIPQDARMSRNISVTPSADIKATQRDILFTRSGQSAFA